MIVQNGELHNKLKFVVLFTSDPIFNRSGVNCPTKSIKHRR